MAQPAPPSAPPAPRTKLTVSRGLAAWLAAHEVSLAFTTYQTGQLFLVGAHPNGTVSFNQQYFVRAMGLAWRPGQLFLAGHIQLWRLENVLAPGTLADETFDQMFVPRQADITGDVDAHELGLGADGGVLFVNTRYSCLATADPVHSFRPVWRPPFVSALAGEDRCHLNGLAMAEGAPRYVTAVGRSDVAGGWRSERSGGGLVIAVADGSTLIDGLSMPHSPRLHGDDLLLLESGRGRLLSVPLTGGPPRAIAFCPGFLRGLAVHDGHAIVTLSKPRDGSFRGLALDALLAARGEAPWCGVMIIRLDTGAIVEWIRLEGQITELFDVAAMPGVRCPKAIGPLSREVADSISLPTFNLAASEVSQDPLFSARFG